jgi:hypothetical protein
VFRELRAKVETFVLANLNKVWVVALVAAFMAALTSVTGITLVEGPEPALSFPTFYQDDQGQVFGPAVTAPLDPSHFWVGNSWKFSSIWGDSLYYRYGTLHGLDGVIAPYRYRILPIYLSQLLFAVTRDEQMAWVLLNVLAIAGAAAITAYIAVKALKASTALAILMPALICALPPIMYTVGFISVDPMTVFFSALIAFALWKKSVPIFIIGAVGGVLTKEIFLVAGVAWLLQAFSDFRAKKNWKQLIQQAIVAALPIITFVTVRLVMGAPILEVNYGYNLATGELPNYWVRFSTVQGLYVFVVSIIGAWTFLWFGAWKWISIKWLRTYAFLLLVGLLVSAGLFSSRVMRIMAPLGPLLALGLIAILQAYAATRTSRRK